MECLYYAYRSTANILAVGPKGLICISKECRCNENWMSSYGDLSEGQLNANGLSKGIRLYQDEFWWATSSTSTSTKFWWGIPWLHSTCSRTAQAKEVLYSHSNTYHFCPSLMQKSTLCEQPPIQKCIMYAVCTKRYICSHDHFHFCPSMMQKSTLHKQPPVQRCIMYVVST